MALISKLQSHLQHGPPDSFWKAGSSEVARAEADIVTPWLQAIPTWTRPPVTAVAYPRQIGNYISWRTPRLWIVFSR